MISTPEVTIHGQTMTDANNKDKGKKLATKGCKEAGAKARSKMQFPAPGTDGGPSKNKKKTEYGFHEGRNRRDEMLE